jgi:hypothetical protein
VNLAASVVPATGCSLSGLPASVTIPPTSTSTLTITCSLTGNYNVTVAGTSGSTTHFASIAVSVVDFTNTASPTSMTLLAGFNGTSTITLGSINGYSATVTCTATVSPAGPTASLSPSSVAVPGTSTLTITTSAGTAAGTYTVTVSCTDGIVTHTSTVTVTVNPEPTFVHGKLSWTHHLSLSKNSGVQTFTSTSENTGPTLVYAQVVVIGSANGIPFQAMSPVFQLTSGTVTKTTFSAPVSSSLVGFKVQFTAMLLYSTSLDGSGNLVTPVNSTVTKSGAFAVVP